MKSIRKSYDRLPYKSRVLIRSLLPNEWKRWYAHKKTDIYLISYPKCGRTWLRLMIGKAICDHYQLEENESTLFLNWSKKVHPEVPFIRVIHEDRPMLKSPDELQTNKSKYHKKKVIFLVRDPRDVIVSSYFEMNKRAKIFGDNPYEKRAPFFEGSINDFIIQKQGGFDTIIQYYNIWAENRHLPAGFLLIKYEDMHLNPQIQLRKVMNFIGLSKREP